MAAAPSGISPGSATATARPSAGTTTRPSPAPTRPPARPPTRTAARWIPRRGITWQWQLAGRLDLAVRAAVYDLDVDDTSAAAVARLHAAGRHVICYVDVGTWESYRADAGHFPKVVLGRAVEGWPNERWLDIRRLDVLAPPLRSRLDTCAAKGFDAVEPDWLDAYDQPTGFRITRADSLRFDRWVAAEAHARGLSIAQKNAPGLAADLRASFDFALVEQCFEYNECSAYRPYYASGVAVLDAEYAIAPSSYCPRARQLGISAIRKRLDLGAWRQACP